MNILISTIDQGAGDSVYGVTHIRDAEHVRSTLPTLRHTVTTDPHHADLILLFEYNGFKTQRFVSVLSTNPLVTGFPDKCFTVNLDDAPVGLLPGLYVSMPHARFDPSRMRAITYMGEYNRCVVDGAERRAAVTPSLLYCFRGSMSHPIRRRVLALPAEPYARVTESFGWFDHSFDAQQAYVNDLLDSQFVICPRGLATTSVRLFEVMQLGRVPVVISDQWVPPDGPDWARVAVRIAENAISDVPRRLAELQPQAAEMGRAARDAWERWFSPVARVKLAVELAANLRATRPIENDERQIQQDWQGWPFWYRHGWTLPQRFGRRAATEVKRRFRGFAPFERQAKA